MARFVYSGKNWEGRSWYSSAAMKQLGQEVETKFTTRRSVDGTVAGKTHDRNSPSSDHRPRPFSGTGIVRAIDIGVGSISEGNVIAEHLRLKRDSRLKYLIFNGRIFSSYDHTSGKAWTWRPYYGSNKHITHLHISLNSSADKSAASWGISSVEGGDIDVREVFARLQASLIRAGYNLGTFPPYLPAGDPDSVPGADGFWGATSRKAQDAANKTASSSTTDATARTSATRANARLDKLHEI